MATLTGKRKREDAEMEHARSKKAVTSANLNGNGKRNLSSSQNPTPKAYISVQIVTGTYERIIHGIHASIAAKSFERNGPSHPENETVTFSDTFLFTAHASSVRCLALSPPTESKKCFLATGSSDERINLYSLSTAPAPKTARSAVPTLESTITAENPRNRSLGNLNHHDRPITRLHFPTKSKLFSAAEDNTIAISRTRDWTVLSSIKAPVPKPQGRPSGDTAGPREVPAGVNDFAIHPSQKLMLSVGRGEKCMRLWNLMTGKKAGVLNFDRELLMQVGEGKYGNGEGRRVIWDESGEKFVIGFERGAAVFGIDSKPKGIIRSSPPTKLHQMSFVPGTSESQTKIVLAVSTEDGRILFYDTQSGLNEPDARKLSSCSCLAELGGERAGISGRIKDFEILPLLSTSNEGEAPLLIVAGSSDGAVRIWTVFVSELTGSPNPEANREGAVNATINGIGKTGNLIGTLIGTLETGNRITCLGAFVMDEKAGAMDDIVLGAEEDEDDNESEDESYRSV